MPKIFLSYRRADSRKDTERIHDRLVNVFSRQNVFLDVDDAIPAAVAWEDYIAEFLNKSQVLLVIIGSQWLDILDERTRNNIQDPVRFEIEQSLYRDDLEIIPIFVDLAAPPSFEARQNYHPDTLELLDKVLRFQTMNVRPNPDFHDDLSKVIREIKRLFPNRIRWVSIFGVLISMVIIGLLIMQFGSSTEPENNTASNPSDTPNDRTVIALLQSETARPSITPTANRTATLDAVATQVAYEIETQTQTVIDSIPDTPTATNTNTFTPTSTNTFTPTDDLPATENAQQTQGAEIAQVTNDQATQNAQLTQNAPTNTLRPSDTPTSTNTPTDTPTNTLTSTPTDTPSPTPNLTGTANAQATNIQSTAQAREDATATAVAMAPTFSPLDIAAQGVTSNDEWIPFEDTINGAEMVLVPAGEFMMGSDEEAQQYAYELCELAEDEGGDCQESWYEDEGDMHRQVFTEPFWIDKTEVTRAMYQECVDAGDCEAPPSSDYSSEDNQPINRVTWFQARDYCEWREARLPTEREWEYAARGPDSLIFPWGNEFNGNLLNHCDVNCAEASWASGSNYTNEENNDGYEVTSPVGSYPEGASWVGAMDLAGNVWEWVNTIYEDYPYDEDDGRNSNSDINSSRVLRGGSFFNSAFNTRSAYRLRYVPTVEYGLDGFRCALSN